MYGIFCLIKLRTTKALYWAHLNYYMYNYGKKYFSLRNFWRRKPRKPTKTWQKFTRGSGSENFTS
jgi:hypothetical protein